MDDFVHQQPAAENHIIEIMAKKTPSTAAIPATTSTPAPPSCQKATPAELTVKETGLLSFAQFIRQSQDR